MEDAKIQNTGTDTGGGTPEREISLRVMAPLCLVAFVGVMNVLGPAPFLDELAEDLDSSVPLVGQAVSIALFTAAFVGLVAGPLADHAGHRKMLLAGVVCAGLSALGTAVAQGYPLFMATRALGGFGSAITIGVTFGAVAAVYSGPARRRALSFVGASLSLGTAVGPLLLTTTSVAAGWRGAFAMMAGLAVVGLVLMALLFPAEEPHGKGRFAFGQILDSYRPILGDQSMLMIYLVWAMRAIGWIGLLGFLGAFFTDEHGYSTETVGFVFLVAGGGYFIGTLTAGSRLGDFNPRAQAMLAMLGLAGGTLALYALPIGAVPSLAALAVAAVSNGVFQVSVMTMAADRTPAGPSTTMVLTETVLSVGAALGGAISGLLLGFGGYALMGAGLSAAGFIGALLLHRRTGRLSIPPAPQPT
ncbi:MAG: MFS transporter [Thermomicrobiales bacterium]